MGERLDKPYFFIHPGFMPNLMLLLLLFLLLLYIKTIYLIIYTSINSIMSGWKTSFDIHWMFNIVIATKSQRYLRTTPGIG